MKKEPRLEAIIEIDPITDKKSLMSNAVNRLWDVFQISQFASPFIRDRMIQHCANIVHSLAVFAVLSDTYEKMAISATDIAKCMNCKREFLYSQIKIRFPKIGIAISDRGINTTQESSLMFLCEECNVPESQKKIIIPGRD